MAPPYARGGRPSVDPELLLRMLLVGYLHGVRSERRLCEQVDLNLAYRWFCRLGLDRQVSDHSTFTKNRHGRFRESGLMRELFERVVEQCLATGLANTDHVVVNGSHVKADANKQRCVKTPEELPRAGEGATRAVREYLADLEAAVTDPVGVVRWTPKAVSTTDPATAFSGKYGRYVFSYGINVMVDRASGIILDARASAARVQRHLELARPVASLRNVSERIALASCGMFPSFRLRHLPRRWRRDRAPALWRTPAARLSGAAAPSGSACPDRSRGRWPAACRGACDP